MAVYETTTTTHHSNDGIHSSSVHMCVATRARVKSLRENVLLCAYYSFARSLALVRELSCGNIVAYGTCVRASICVCTCANFLYYVSVTLHVTVEVSEVVSSLSRVSTTCPRSLTIRCLYRLSSIYTTTIHVLTSPPSSFLTVTLLILFLFLFNFLSPYFSLSYSFFLSFTLKVSPSFFYIHCTAPPVSPFVSAPFLPPLSPRLSLLLPLPSPRDDIRERASDSARIASSRAERAARRSPPYTLVSVLTYTRNVLPGILSHNGFIVLVSNSNVCAIVYRE